MIPKAHPRRTYVHFGMPKTGSTSIQWTLYRYFHKPRETWCHVGMGLKPSGNRFIDVVFRTQVPQGFQNIMKKYAISADQLLAERAEMERIFARNLQEVGERTAVLTSESIPGLDFPKLKDLQRRIAEAGLEARAVGYIRAPKGYIESNFQEEVKGGNGEFRYAALFPRYRNRFEPLERAFGRDNVEFWPFEPKTFVNGCVVQDFCSRIELKMPARRAVRSNDSLSLPALTLLYTYRKLIPKHISAKFTVGTIELIKRLQSLEGAKLRFHSSLIEPLVEEHREQMAWMEDRGVSLKEDLTASDATAVRSEEDLLTVAPESLLWLAENILDKAIAKRVLSGDPRDIAEGMQQLEIELARGGKTPSLV